MTLYTILSSKKAGIDRCDLSLSNACRELGIEYKQIFFDTTTLDDLKEMYGNATGALYRISTNKQAARIENLLNDYAPGLSTIWDGPSPRGRKLAIGELREIVSSDLPHIPTILLDQTWLKMTDDEFIRRFKKIDGFPVVIKTLGLSHGMGVRKFDTLAELREELPSILDTQNNVIARKYLADYRHYRIISLNGEVAAAIEYHKPDDDFRTNATKDPRVTPIAPSDVPADVASAAIDATSERGSMFGGADVLVDLQTGKALLAEVNIPCFFARAEEPTGINVGKKLVEALVVKSQV